MRRREFFALISSAAVAGPFAAMAQEAGRIYRLGMSFNFPHDTPFPLRVLDELRHRGFAEGQNLTVDSSARYALVTVPTLK
jgi:hypothetical protein